MGWVIAGIVAGFVFLGGAAWMLGPTLRTFRGPAFEPTSKDDASVLRAQQSGNSSGAGE